MSGFFTWIKKKFKWFLGLFIFLLVAVFLVVYTLHYYEKNRTLENRINRLEADKERLSMSPNQHYQHAMDQIRMKEFDKALETLYAIKSRTPDWKPKLVDRTINATIEAEKNVEKTTEQIFSKIENSDSESDEIIVDENGNELYGEATQPSPTFKTFEYENNKEYPFRTSNTGHNPTKYNFQDSKNKILSNAKKTRNEQGFTKFEFEDDRYKKNKPPVQSRNTLNEKRKTDSVKVVIKKADSVKVKVKKK